MHILEYPDNQLESHWPGTMIDLFEAHPRAMVHRTQRGTGFTLIHGDVNPGNILVPHGGDRSPEGEGLGTRSLHTHRAERNAQNIDFTSA